MSEALARYKNYVQAFLLTSTAMAMVASIIAGAFVLFSDWGQLPAKVEQLQNSVTRVEQQLGARDLRVVEILGNDIAVTTPKVKAGDPVWVLFQARATIDCEREILVRFYNEDERGFHPTSRTDPAVRSAVSLQYQPLHIPIKTFEDMAPGRYRYAAEIVPMNCGIYGRQAVSFSEVFEIVE